MIDPGTYNTLIAASASAGVVMTAISVLWFITKDIKGAWKTIRTEAASGQLAAAAERKHAMRVVRKEARKHGKLETIKVAGTLTFVPLSEIPDAVWPPVKMRLAMPEDRRTALARCLTRCEKTQSTGNGLRCYAESDMQLRLLQN